MTKYIYKIEDKPFKDYFVVFDELGSVGRFLSKYFGPWTYVENADLSEGCYGWVNDGVDLQVNWKRYPILEDQADWWIAGLEDLNFEIQDPQLFNSEEDMREWHEEQGWVQEDMSKWLSHKDYIDPQAIYYMHPMFDYRIVRAERFDGNGLE